MPVDPAAAALCERIRRAGSGVFAGRTVAEVRRAGLDLAGTWSLGEVDLAIVTHLARGGEQDLDRLASSVGLPAPAAKARLEALRSGGFVRQRERAGVAPQWSSVISGRRRRRHADGALSLLLDRPADGLLPEPGGRSNVDLGDGVGARVYRSSSAPSPAPIVLFVHGGAFVSGTLDSYDNICDAMAELADCIVVSLDYRLAPEYPFPSPVLDTIAGLRWVVDHAAALGGDPTWIAIMGDSAGGNLATVAATTAAREGWCHAVLQVLLYPVLDVSMTSPSVEEHATAPLFSKADLAWMYEHYGAPQSDWRASPLVADNLAGVPPALIVTADVDPVRDDGRRYADLLAASGVDVSLVNVEGMMHGFFAFAPALDQATDARRLVADELRRRFGTHP